MNLRHLREAVELQTQSDSSTPAIYHTFMDLSKTINRAMLTKALGFLISVAKLLVRGRDERGRSSRGDCDQLFPTVVGEPVQTPKRCGSRCGRASIRGAHRQPVNVLAVGADQRTIGKSSCKVSMSVDVLSNVSYLDRPGAVASLQSYPDRMIVRKRCLSQLVHLDIPRSSSASSRCS